MTMQTDVREDRELKSRHRTMWALGDYPQVATALIPALGHVLVEACGIGPRDRVLDVAAGSGNVAVPAAVAGASVVASDLTPELLAAGEDAVRGRGLDLAWEVGDAEALPYDDASFDVVVSSVGAMFAPHHAATAGEILRVCRPGGRIGLASWTPEGFIGQMFAAMKPYVAPPPPGVQPPLLWGTEEHVRELFGDRVTDLRAERRSVRVDRFAAPEEFRDFFKATYGPTIAAYRGLEETPDRAAALDQELADLARRHDLAPGASATPDGDAPWSRLVLDWEYLLVTARRGG